MKSRTVNIEETSYRIRSAIGDINTMFIGIVTSVNYTRNNYSVQPVLKYKGSDDIVIETAVVANCPMCFIKTKDFYIRAPYTIGDMVYVGCSKQSVEESIVDASTKENRLDGVSLFRQVDGVILGGIMSDSEPDLNSSYQDDFIIQNRNNQDLVVIKKEGGILAKTNTVMTIDAPTTDITGNVNIVGNVTTGGTMDIDGFVTAKSNVAVAGALQSTGSISADGGVAATGSITTDGAITTTGAITGLTVTATSTGNSL